jgi:hypothetical protein
MVGVGFGVGLAVAVGFGVGSIVGVGIGVGSTVAVASGTNSVGVGDAAGRAQLARSSVNTSTLRSIFLFIRLLLLGFVY